MQRSSHTLINNRAWVTFSVIYLGSAEVFQNGNKCFKASLYYLNRAIFPWREAKNPEVLLTWIVGNCDAEWHFRLIQHHKTGTYCAWASNICGQKRWLKVELIVVFNYLLGDCKEERTRPLPQVHSERTRGNMHKLQQGNTEWDIKKKFLTETITREVMESPSLEVFKTWLNKTEKTLT